MTERHIHCSAYTEQSDRHGNDRRRYLYTLDAVHIQIDGALLIHSAGCCSIRTHCMCSHIGLLRSQALYFISFTHRIGSLHINLFTHRIAPVTQTKREATEFCLLCGDGRQTHSTHQGTQYLKQCLLCVRLCVRGHQLPWRGIGSTQVQYMCNTGAMQVQYKCSTTLQYA